MTPEVEKALATPDSQRLLKIAMGNHATDLKKHAKNDDDEGYAQAASQRRSDAAFIEEVVLPAFSAQTGLELDQTSEVKAYIAGMVLRRLKRLKAEVARFLMDEEDAKADDAVINAANSLGEEMGKLTLMIAERAHHDGVTSRQLAPTETLGRVLKELTGSTREEVT